MSSTLTTLWDQVGYLYLVVSTMTVSTRCFAGFSFSDKLPTTHEEVADNLYEFLQQWFQLFPEYQVVFLAPTRTQGVTLSVYQSSSF